MNDDLDRAPVRDWPEYEIAGTTSNLGVVMSQIDPHERLARMWENAPRLAEAKANRVYLEGYTKTIKATLMCESDARSAVAQERDAYSDHRYEAHLLGLKQAVHDEELIRWQMVTDEAAIEVWRSMEASNRGMDRGTR